MLRPISRFKLAVKVIGWHCLVFLCILSCYWPSFTILFFKFILFNHLATFRAYCITLILHILTLFFFFFLLNPRPVEDMRDYVNNPLGSNLGQCTLHICLWLIAFACPLSCYLLAGKLTVCVSLCYLSLWGIVQPRYGKEGSPFFCAPCTHGRISAYECCLLLRCSDTEEPSMLSTGVLRRACAHVCALMHSYVCFIQNVLFNIFSCRWQERLSFSCWNLWNYLDLCIKYW